VDSATPVPPIRTNVVRLFQHGAAMPRTHARKSGATKFKGRFDHGWTSSGS